MLKLKYFVLQKTWLEGVFCYAGQRNSSSKIATMLDKLKINQFKIKTDNLLESTDSWKAARTLGENRRDLWSSCMRVLLFLAPAWLVRILVCQCWFSCKTRRFAARGSQLNSGWWLRGWVESKNSGLFQLKLVDFIKNKWGNPQQLASPRLQS